MIVENDRIANDLLEARQRTKKFAGFTMTNMKKEIVVEILEFYSWVVYVNCFHKLYKCITTLRTVTYILYTVYMVTSKVNISTTISFFIFVMVNPANFFVLCLASSKSFAILSFSTIKN